MKVCGFTFVRNAVKFQYPVVEAITSVLPLCDKFIVAVGNSADDTLALVKSINSEKIEIIQTIWDDTQRKGGRVLALETDKAFQAVPEDMDWCFYIQADEVLHEKYYPAVQEAMKKYLPEKRIEGLLFNYLHFYGSFDYVGESLQWYRREIRIIRNDKTIFSYKDAQGFRIKPNRKLCVRHIDATIYHYGWVREPVAMRKKQDAFTQLYRPADPTKNQTPTEAQFEYSTIDALRKFDGTHPGVMQARVSARNWAFHYDERKKQFLLKDRFKRIIEKYTGWRPGEYRNYKICK